MLERSAVIAAIAAGRGGPHGCACILCRDHSNEQHSGERRDLFGRPDLAQCRANSARNLCGGTHADLP